MDTVVWLALMIVFLIVESATVVMVSLWFAAGSLVAMAASLLGASVPFQIALFLIVSAVEQEEIFPKMKLKILKVWQ